MDKSKLINEYNSLVKDAPKEFYSWIDEKLMHYYLFFKIKGRKMNCKCSKCGNEYTAIIKQGMSYEQQMTENVMPRPDNHGTLKCIKCGKTVECINRGKLEKKDWRTSFLCEKIEDGIVIRKFSSHSSTQMHGITFIKHWESSRMFLIKDKPSLKTYRYGYGWNTSANGDFDPTAIYGAEHIFNSHLKYCAYENYRYGGNLVKKDEEGIEYLSGCDYLYAYNNMPMIEMLSKMGLDELVSYTVQNKGICGFINTKKKGLEQIFKIKNQRFKMLQKSSGKLELLKILQLEKRNGWKVSEDEILKISNCVSAIGIKDFQEIIKYMTPTQLINRLEKYLGKEISKTNYYTGLLTKLYRYRDYLKMRSELGYDMKNTVFLFPKNLDSAHSEMISEKEKRSNESLIKDMEAKFPQIKEQFSKILKKYEMHKDGLFIRPAKSAEEIIIEGRNLHHCVGREYYIEKHSKGISYILLLRHEADPDIPFITVEIDKKGIVQWYGAYDKKPEDSKYENFLNEFTQEKILKKKERKAS